MTIAEKSTELGYDLGQLILDSNPIRIKETCPTNGFKCFKIEGAIPADENQRGSKENFYYFCSNIVDESLPQSVQDAMNALTATSTAAEVEAAYLLWIGEQSYTEKDLELTIEEF